MPIPTVPTITPETEEIPSPDLQPFAESTPQTGSNYRVILYNDDYHDVDEVTFQVQKATGCSLERAEAITLEAHITGRAICFRGARSECENVCRVLRKIQLQCEIDCD